MTDKFKDYAMITTQEQEQKEYEIFIQSERNTESVFRAKGIKLAIS